MENKMIGGMMGQVGSDAGGITPGAKATHKEVMAQMAHDQMKELVKEALKEAYDPKPKKTAGAGTEPCCPYDDQSRIVENGMSDDRVIFEQKGKTYSQGFEISSGKANLLSSRQQVMITWTPVPGGGKSESSEGEDQAQAEPEPPTEKGKDEG